MANSGQSDVADYLNRGNDMSKLDELWNAARANPGEAQPLGDTVVCDICSADYTHRNESGGFIFSSSAYCPECAVKGMESIKRYGEERHIKATCPPDQSFADFVREYRGPDAGITIHTL